MRWLVIVVLVGCTQSHAMEPPDGADNPDGMTTGDAGDAGSDAMMPPPTAAELLAKLQTCNMVGGNYAKDSGGTQNIPICSVFNGVFWKADMDIDCDGQPSAECNSMTDPSFQAQTSAVDSHGNYLDSAALPYVVVPLPSSRFDYSNAGLEFGSVIAVIYQDKVEYGVFGDEGPTSIIGEASYRMAQSLGIDPDPSTGGADSGVAYIAFTGSAAVAMPIEDHDAAVRVGIAKAQELLAH